MTPVGPNPLLTKTSPARAVDNPEIKIEIAENCNFANPTKMASKLKAADWGKIAKVASRIRLTLTLSGSSKYNASENMAKKTEVKKNLKKTMFQRSSEALDLSFATSLTKNRLKPKSATDETMEK